MPDTARRNSHAIRTLLPPGGFSNAVGVHVAALDAGSELLRATARAIPDAAFHRAPGPGVPSPAAALLAVGAREALWLHQGVGGVPTPPAPEGEAPRDEILGWLDAVRTVSLMVLRPLAERDLERLYAPEDGGAPVTLRRLLCELLEHQGFRRGEMATAARLGPAR
jgi:hypothetical protein